MSDEEKKENPLDGIKEEMQRLLRQQWEQRMKDWRAPNGGESKDASSGEVPDSVKKAMEAYPEAFGLPKPPAFSPKVEEEATRILSDSDLDREAAKLLLDHHKGELESALDRKDPEAFRRASAEVASHKEAAEALSKPKGHFTRQAFERKQAASVSPKGAFER
ncbi:MAG: hypothetical protein FJX23_00555 [Alphaproteobacteria bacterium]|nr:hypothetical protein [Alphaproteobacteria bacterium]